MIWALKPPFFNLRLTTRPLKRTIKCSQQSKFRAQRTQQHARARMSKPLGRISSLRTLPPWSPALGPVEWTSCTSCSWSQQRLLVCAQPTRHSLGTPRCQVLGFQTTPRHPPWKAPSIDGADQRLLRKKGVSKNRWVYSSHKICNRRHSLTLCQAAEESHLLWMTKGWPISKFSKTCMNNSSQEIAGQESMQARQVTSKVLKMAHHVWPTDLSFQSYRRPLVVNKSIWRVFKTCASTRCVSRCEPRWRHTAPPRISADWILVTKMASSSTRKTWNIAAHRSTRASNRYRQSWVVQPRSTPMSAKVNKCYQSNQVGERGLIKAV